jgi:outer membrane protein assembly factor BamB
MMSHHERPGTDWLGALAVALALSIASRATADDWPQWRGPERNGVVERSPPLLNSLAGQAPVWVNDSIPSGERGGRGSLIVRAGKVYGLTSAAAAASSAQEVFCLEAATGKTLWRVPFGGVRKREAGSATPCIVLDKLYVAGAGGELLCLSADTGAVIWESQLPRSENRAIASSVAVAGDTAVVLADVLTGFDPHTGKVRWTQEKIAGHESSPAFYSAGGRSYVICNSAEQTHAVDAVDGTIVWSVPGGGKSTPVVAREYGGDFLVNTADNRRTGLSVYRLTPTPQKLWTLKASDRAASPVVFDGHVYAVAGGSAGHGARLLCVHLDTGRVAWDESIDFAEVSSPIVADGKLFAVCGTFLWLLQATPEKYGVLSQVDCRITLCTSPALVEGRLYLRQANGVVCYDLRAAP